MANGGVAPIHAPGRSSILATAIGEESFIDANGNGQYDAGETFYDRAERFRDDADATDDNFDSDTGYQSTTPIPDFFYDFNNNGVRDSADGIFEGVLCTAGPPICDPTKTTTGIGKRSLIIFSTSQALIFQSPANSPAGVTLAHGTTAAVVFQIEDLNGNPIPYDAAITAKTAGQAGTISPTGFTEGCSIHRGGDYFSFELTAGTTAGSGTITITVTTKSNVVSSITVPVTVT